MNKELILEARAKAEWYGITDARPLLNELANALEDSDAKLAAWATAVEDYAKWQWSSRRAGW